MNLYLFSDVEKRCLYYVGEIDTRYKLSPGRTVTGGRFGHPADLKPRSKVGHVHAADGDTLSEWSRFQFHIPLIRQRDCDCLLQRLVSDDDEFIIVRIVVHVNDVGDVVVGRGRYFWYVAFARFFFVNLDNVKD